MEAHNSAQRVQRPCAFDKMEGLVREMQDSENGVPVRSQKQFLTSIPAAFMGYDLIEWLIDRLSIDESEAVHLANQLCQYGYFFPVNDSKTLTIKDDSSLYRFQTPYYWPWQHTTPDNVEYAIYLAKRTLRNKQRHALEDYETEALKSLRQNLQNKWDIIQHQAEEQVRVSKDRKKGDKIVSDSQERAFWRVYRPPPGYPSSLEVVPVPTRGRPGVPRPPLRKRTLNDLQREVELLRNSLTRTRIKVSAAVGNLKTYFDTYAEYDPLMVPPQPSNPWCTDDSTFWQLNSPLVEVPTEKRVRRWALSMGEIMSDPTGLQEFTNYLRKEYSHENIRFWLAVKELRHCCQAQICDRVNEIFKEFLAPGAPCEINIDGKTMEKVHQEMRNPSRFTFDSAAEHVYTLLLKKDCYPRFIRSDHYRNLLAAGVQPLQKKRFFVFGGQTKKKISTSAAPMPGSLQQQHSNMGSGGGGRRRGSDRSLSGSAHELAVIGVRDVTSIPRVPHSHSQSNLTDIPYRGDLVRLVNIRSRPSPRSVQDAGVAEGAARPMDDVCPWDAAPGPSSAGEQAASHQQSSTGAAAVAAQQHHQPADVAAQVSSSSGGMVGASADGGGSTTSMHLTHQLSGAGEASRSSRKNSSQLDSCSSSSDVSLAIAEVSERLKKSVDFRHQMRSGSMIVGGVAKNYPSGGQSVAGGARVKLADTSRPSSYNYPSSPQQSFDFPHILAEKLESISSVRTVPEETENNREDSSEIIDDDDRCKSRDSQGPKTPPTVMAPLISISAIVGELTGDTDRTIDNEDSEQPDEDLTLREIDEPQIIDLTPADSSTITHLPTADHPNLNDTDEPQVVPVWEPDQRADDTAESEGATAQKPQEQRDNNVNEVCPWEDEDCKVDAPYVKTYATLGYL
ncbi:regulator of G-protein signaling 9 isoform X2 [Venturia canescens]|uniref:regulator of G-protein signaling 9 isoform X2 n=1 Tax=Venturia canescens TaxID=32260 RepID=UPI001C9CD788|nr:regulator of G-protein signaling 9 isoform X2 [Venturia canescens]